MGWFQQLCLELIQQRIIFTDKAGFNAKNYDGKSTNPDDLESHDYE